jgi:hypothetical protein
MFCFSHPSGSIRRRLSRALSSLLLPWTHAVHGNKPRGIFNKSTCLFVVWLCHTQPRPCHVLFLVLFGDTVQQYDSCHHRTTSSVVALLWSLLFVACESFILHSATAVRACALPTSTTASTLSLLLLLLLLVLASVPSRDLRWKQNEIHSRPLLPCHVAPRPDLISRNPHVFVCV